MTIYDNEFNLLSGMLFYDNCLSDIIASFSMFLTVIAEYPSYHALNEVMTPALYYLKLRMNSPSFIVPDDAHISQEVLLPCRGQPSGYLDAYTCSVIGINSYNYTSGNKQVSDYHYILQAGSYSDSMSIPNQGSSFTFPHFQYFIIHVCMYMYMYMYVDRYLDR